jgi:hypothetical protein
MLVKTLHGFLRGITKVEFKLNTPNGLINIPLMDEGWVATGFWVASNHLACPDLGAHAHVCAPPIYGGRTSHPHPHFL